MQVSAINSFNNYSHVNFGSKKGWRNATIAAAIATPLVVTSCNPPDINLSAKATAVAFVTPGGGCDGCGRDTVYVTQNDTIYFPVKGIEIPQGIMDSLRYYQKCVLDTKLPIDKENDDPSYRDQVLLSLHGKRDWDFKNPEHIRLNLFETNKDRAVYDHVAVRSDEGFSDRRMVVTNGKQGEVTVVRENGSLSNKLGGTLFEENGKKFFVHSNGSDSLYLYKRAEEGVNAGKYEFVGKLGRGYLPKDKYGENFMLDSILGDGTEDHMVDISGVAMGTPDLFKLYDEIINENKQ